MSDMIQRIGPNLRGRDIAVGDIHGHFLRLETALARIDFDPQRDRLFSVGDLVDRGPDSIAALDWLAKPWFHAVLGNHEDYATRFRTVDVENWVINGGAWFQLLPEAQKQQVSDVFATLPYALEVETAGGLVGIVHADCPVENWQHLREGLLRSSVRSKCIWSRTRITEEDTSGVAGIHAVVVGHTPISAPVTLGNVHHIDTAGWTSSGHFSLLDLSTMTVL